MDLIIRRATLPPSATSQHKQHKQPVDIGIEAGRIVAVEPNLAAVRAKKLMPPARSSRRRSSIRISTWTRRCRTVCRA
jgi:hypothetical protein